MSANALGRMDGGLASIERCLETRMDIRFPENLLSFVPPSVPPVCFRYPLNLECIGSIRRASKLAFKYWRIFTVDTSAGAFAAHLLIWMFSKWGFILRVRSNGVTRVRAFQTLHRPLPIAAP